MIIGGVAIVLGCFVEYLEINFMVGQAFAIAAASYFPLLFMSVWWRGMTMKGAAIGMLTGGLCALIAAALTNFSTLALDKGPMTLTGGNVGKARPGDANGPDEEERDPSGRERRRGGRPK